LSLEKGLPSLPLSRLAPGQSGRICAPAPGEAIPQRLQDLGFVPGTLLSLRRRSPLGDPVELELRGYRICLRTEQLEAVRVELVQE
jgi:ferrous iron transport protein A